MSCTEAFTHLPQIVDSEEKRIGGQSSTMIQASYGGWWKGTSQDKAMLIIEEMKPVTLAELCLSECMSK